MHPGILQIPNNATRVASYELKRVYKDNLRVLQRVIGVEQALIQQVVTAVYEQYIISMKNFTTGKFTGNTRQIVAYLFSMYGKISPSHFDDFKKEVTDMHYDPVTLVDKFFNNIEDLLE